MKTAIMFLSFILLVLMFEWINYLVDNNYVVYQEGIKTKTYNDDTSAQQARVDMPLNTTTSCSNMCGPQNRCSISGQQCFADIDCPGCEPQSTATSIADKKTTEVVGENDSGKLTSGMSVNYSDLTSDIGSRAQLIVSDKYEKSVTPHGKINTWDEQFNLSRKLFDDRYKPVGLSGMPSYRKTYTLSGEFDDEGPLASNSYLS